MYKFGTDCYLSLRLLQPPTVNCAGLCDHSNKAWGQREEEEQSVQRLKHFHETVDAFLKLQHCRCLMKINNASKVRKTTQEKGKTSLFLFASWRLDPPDLRFVGAVVRMFFRIVIVFVCVCWQAYLHEETTSGNQTLCP